MSKIKNLQFDIFQQQTIISLTNGGSKLFSGNNTPLSCSIEEQEINVSDTYPSDEPVEICTAGDLFLVATKSGFIYSIIPDSQSEEHSPSIDFNHPKSLEKGEIGIHRFKAVSGEIMSIQYLPLLDSIVTLERTSHKEGSSRKFEIPITYIRVYSNWRRNNLSSQTSSNLSNSQSELSLSSSQQLSSGVIVTTLPLSPLSPLNTASKDSPSNSSEKQLYTHCFSSISGFSVCSFTNRIAVASSPTEIAIYYYTPTLLQLVLELSTLSTTTLTTPTNSFSVLPNSSNLSSISTSSISSMGPTIVSISLCDCFLAFATQYEIRAFRIQVEHEREKERNFEDLLNITNIDPHSNKSNQEINTNTESSKETKRNDYDQLLGTEYEQEPEELSISVEEEMFSSFIQRDQKRNQRRNNKIIQERERVRDLKKTDRDFDVDLDHSQNENEREIDIIERERERERDREIEIPFSPDAFSVCDDDFIFPCYFDSFCDFSLPSISPYTSSSSFSSSSPSSSGAISPSPSSNAVTSPQGSSTSSTVASNSHSPTPSSSNFLSNNLIPPINFHGFSSNPSSPLSQLQFSALSNTLSSSLSSLSRRSLSSTSVSFGSTNREKEKTKDSEKRGKELIVSPSLDSSYSIRVNTTDGYTLLSSIPLLRLSLSLSDPLHSLYLFSEFTPPACVVPLSLSSFSDDENNDNNNNSADIPNLSGMDSNGSNHTDNMTQHPGNIVKPNTMRLFYSTSQSGTLYDLSTTSTTSPTKLSTYVYTTSPTVSAFPTSSLLYALSGSFIEVWTLRPPLSLSLTLSPSSSLSPLSFLSPSSPLSSLLQSSTSFSQSGSSLNPNNSQTQTSPRLISVHTFISPVRVVIISDTEILLLSKSSLASLSSVTKRIGRITHKEKEKTSSKPREREHESLKNRGSRPPREREDQSEKGTTNISPLPALPRTPSPLRSVLLTPPSSGLPTPPSSSTNSTSSTPLPTLPSSLPSTTASAQPSPATPLPTPPSSSSTLPAPPTLPTPPSSLPSPQPNTLPTPPSTLPTLPSSSLRSPPSSLPSPPSSLPSLPPSIAPRPSSHGRSVLPAPPMQENASLSVVSPLPSLPPTIRRGATTLSPSYRQQSQQLQQPQQPPQQPQYVWNLYLLRSKSISSLYSLFLDEINLLSPPTLSVASTQTRSSHKGTRNKFYVQRTESELNRMHQDSNDLSSFLLESYFLVSSKLSSLLSHYHYYSSFHSWYHFHYYKYYFNSKSKSKEKSQDQITVWGPSFDFEKFQKETQMYVSLCRQSASALAHYYYFFRDFYRAAKYYALGDIEIHEAISLFTEPPIEEERILALTSYLRNVLFDPSNSSRVEQEIFHTPPPSSLPFSLASVSSSSALSNTLSSSLSLSPSAFSLSPSSSSLTLSSLILYLFCLHSPEHLSSLLLDSPLLLLLSSSPSLTSNSDSPHSHSPLSSSPSFSLHSSLSSNSTERFSLSNSMCDQILHSLALSGPDLLPKDTFVQGLLYLQTGDINESIKSFLSLDPDLFIQLATSHPILFYNDMKIFNKPLSQFGDKEKDNDNDNHIEKDNDSLSLGKVLLSCSVWILLEILVSLHSTFPIPSALNLLSLPLKKDSSYPEQFEYRLAFECYLEYVISHYSLFCPLDPPPSPLPSPSVPPNPLHSSSPTLSVSSLSDLLFQSYLFNLNSVSEYLLKPSSDKLKSKHTQKYPRNKDKETDIIKTEFGEESIVYIHHYKYNNIRQKWRQRHRKRFEQYRFHFLDEIPPFSPSTSSLSSLSSNSYLNSSLSMLSTSFHDINENNTDFLFLRKATNPFQQQEENSMSNFYYYSLFSSRIPYYSGSYFQKNKNDDSYFPSFLSFASFSSTTPPSRSPSSSHFFSNSISLTLPSSMSTSSIHSLYEFLFLLYLKKTQSFLSSPEKKYPREMEHLLSLLDSNSRPSNLYGSDSSIFNSLCSVVLPSECFSPNHFPGKESLVFLMFASLQKHKETIIYLLHTQPSLLQEYGKVFFSKASEWGIMLEEILVWCNELEQYQHSSPLNMKMSSSTSGTRIPSVAILEVYEQLLEYLSDFYSPSVFLEMLPKNGKLNFFLSFILKSFHKKNSRVLRDQIKTTSD